MAKLRLHTLPQLAPGQQSPPRPLPAMLVGKALGEEEDLGLLSYLRQGPLGFGSRRRAASPLPKPQGTLGTLCFPAPKGRLGRFAPQESSEVGQLSRPKNLPREHPHCRLCPGMISLCQHSLK